ncbi:DNA internalization-related competence protein ComEC/Rec2 [Alteromonas lipolytica]|uniref:DNA internalization-related competence protein ComEC/Rec2 n=1 Tax=Alteromonas lipolytica TaxID=1856405 RepID=UPI001E4806D4|nr:DNA internalization-related competence protein ComEC/Rec2 [Alteromonas lipolytica]
MLAIAVTGFIVTIITAYFIAKPLQKMICNAGLVSLSTIAGVLMAASVGQSYQTLQQQGGEIQQDVTIQGRIVGFQHYPDYDRIILNQVLINHQSLGRNWSVLLNYYRPEKSFAVGQQINARARIKPARAVANPYGFDKQQWYLSRAIVKTGYIRGQAIWLTTPDVSLRGKLQARLDELNTSGDQWLRALLFGDRQGFSQHDWAVLQRTGTAHLFAISGLHLMIVAAASFWLIKLLTSIAIAVGVPLPKSVLVFSILAGLACCTFYAYLAGWQIAVVRALAVVCLVAVAYIFSHRSSRLSLLIFSLLLSILLNPLAVYGIALYLSVGAVAIIAIIHWRFAGQYHLSGWQTFIFMQLALCVLMLPLVAGLMGQVSIIAPVVNLVVVPVMTMLVIPLSLAGLLLLMLEPYASWSAALVLSLSGTLLEWLMGQVVNIDHWFGELSSRTVSLQGLAVLTAGLAILLLFPAFKGRFYLLLVSVLAWGSATIKDNTYNDSWQIHFLDVGQGSAALVTQRGQAILIDTGAAFASGFNFLSAVIRPFIEARGLILDKVIVSHEDNDHAGGLMALAADFPATELLTTSDECVMGTVQKWQSLTITVLWPPPAMAEQYSDNNYSCVIALSDDHHRVLLPGDIEAKVEQQLIARYPASQLAATVLLAPHHGSKTSSSPEFVSRVAPDYVVYSQGWLNRWGFPHQAVVGRYQALGSHAIQLSKTGYLWFEFNQQTVDIGEYRRSLSSKWFHKTFSN